MNKNTTLIVAIVAVVALLAIMFMMRNRTATDTAMSDQTPTTVMEPTTTTDAMQPTTGDAMEKEDDSTMIVTLTAQNDSGQEGSATLTDEAGKTKVVLTLTGGEFTDPQPAHIHMGSCPTPGAVTYPLTNVVDGKSTTTLDVSLSDLRTKGPFAVNVHKSAAEVKVYTSCGDLK